MITIIIDNKQLNVAEGTTILQAARDAGIAIPTLCYLEGINDIGACRLCIVEVEGQTRLVPSCNTKAEDGMVIRTNTEKVRNARRLNAEMILSQHHCECTTCVRSGNCVLQKIANDLGIMNISYPKKIKNITWNQEYPLIRDESRCVKCMRCIQVCNKVQGMRVWDVVNTGGRTTVGLADGKTIDTAACALCGQCITHCPVGALKERDDTDKVLNAIADPDIITVVQVAPAVRTAWGEALGLSDELATEKRMAAALRKLGFDYVFDTNFSADLTIMEEGSELVHMFEHTDWYDWPLFTSCCPGWVRFLKTQYPEMVEHLSTSKSPQQMFGAVAKSYFAEQIDVDPKKIYSVSIMPCLAKKYECAVEDLNDAGAGQDVDVVLTTREFTRMIKRAAIDAAMLPEEEFDSPLGTGTGAAVIFGATGGVMEAALRSAYYLIKGENPPAEAFTEVRGGHDWREATFEVNGITLRTAVASGLGNARKLVEAIKAGEVQYDFVEVMACPGGCAGGGGQPIHEGCELFASRGQKLYALDAANTLRFSHENPAVQAVYRDFFKKPLSNEAEELLHTNQKYWNL
ncbi:MAG: (2Fe-2S)-binding protein [Peptococcaceae bacterium]|nr:(2Fe-2S)-binding protein [Peptococcaceae bacterium]